MPDSGKGVGERRTGRTDETLTLTTATTPLRRKHQWWDERYSHKGGGAEGAHQIRSNSEKINAAWSPTMPLSAECAPASTVRLMVKMMLVK